MKKIAAVLMIITSLSCCSKSSNSKYTNADMEFLSSMPKITNNISKHSDELAIEMKKYPNINYEYIFTKIKVLLNVIDNGMKVKRPDNFTDAYNLWNNGLNDMREALLLLDNGLEKHNIKFLSEGSVKMKSAGKTMNEMAINMKEHIKAVNINDKNNR